MTTRKPRQIRKGSRFGCWRVVETGLRNRYGKPAARCVCDRSQAARLVPCADLLSGKARRCRPCAVPPAIVRKGQQFGQWMVIDPDRRLGRKRASLCRCACDNEREVLNASLLEGRSRSCGHDLPDPPKVGDEFGNWIVIDPNRKRGQARAALCRCGGCGTEHLVVCRDLRSGESKGCMSCMQKARRLKAPRKGRKFGRLTVLSARTVLVPRGQDMLRAVPCRCACKTELLVLVGALLNGHIQSCGCLARDSSRENIKIAISSPAAHQWHRSEAGIAASREHFTTHGLSYNPLYRVWIGMMRRCYNPEQDSYPSYGGRAVPITVCERWHDVRNFVTDIEREIGPRPEGRTPGGMPLYTIDRIDVNGNYEPGNVRWATAKEQAANKRPMIGNELAELPADDPWTCPWPECGATGLTERQWDAHLRKAHGGTGGRRSSS